MSASQHPLLFCDLRDHYTIVQNIGKGSFSKVYLAYVNDPLELERDFFWGNEDLPTFGDASSTEPQYLAKTVSEVHKVVESDAQSQQLSGSDPLLWTGGVTGLSLSANAEATTEETDQNISLSEHLMPPEITADRSCLNAFASLVVPHDDFPSQQQQPSKFVNSGEQRTASQESIPDSAGNRANNPASLHSSLCKPRHTPGIKFVALKTLRPGLDIRQFKNLREHTFFVRVPRHPHLATIYQMFIDSVQLQFNIVMEYLECNLYELMKSRNNALFSLQSLQEISRQILLGVQHIHNHGFIHRDLKPENILVSTGQSAFEPRYIVKVGDFGLSKYIGSRPVCNGVTTRGKYHTDPGAMGSSLDPQSLYPYGSTQRTVLLSDDLEGNFDPETYYFGSELTFTSYVATRWYRAPELLLRAPAYSFAADIWAFGALFLEMANLKPKFRGKDNLDQLHIIIGYLGLPGRVSYGGDWQQFHTLGAQLMIQPQPVCGEISLFFLFVYI